MNHNASLFGLSSRPDVYFAGNCEQFETRLVDSCGNAIDDDATEVARVRMMRVHAAPWRRKVDEDTDLAIHLDDAYGRASSLDG